MNPSPESVEEKLNRIESEMKRIGMWQDQPLEPEQLDFHQAFGGDAMAFSQWLQFIFVPRVRQIVAEKGKFPSQSQVGDQAFREWKMWGDEPNVEELIAMLKDFDGMFG